MSEKKKKYYVVWKGNKPGIYDTWDECSREVAGFAGAQYKSFPTKAEAEYAFQKKPESVLYAGKEKTKKEQSSASTKMIPISVSVVVDAAWNSVQKDMEYQGIFYHTGKRIFHHGPLANGTNNIGEFLAIVHALGYCKKHGLDDIPIYSDSRNAIGWVKQKKCKTNLELSAKTKHIHELIQRAESWLQNNAYKNKVLKWETEDWGENPADFGRK